MCVCGGGGGGGWSQRVGAGGARFSTVMNRLKTTESAILIYLVYFLLSKELIASDIKKILRRRPLDLYSRLPIFARLVHLNDLKRSPQQKLCDATFTNSS